MDNPEYEHDNGEKRSVDNNGYNLRSNNYDAAIIINDIICKYHMVMI